jgi:LmbE family N-acetylglucosaminyl deacetylase
MISLGLEECANRELQILCLGCHSDDIEIGCGGTILTLAKRYPACKLHWVVFSAHGQREEEARRAAELFGSNRLKTSLFHDFRDGFLPFLGTEVKAIFEDLKGRVSPDLILTHNRKEVAELTWNTFRDHLILEYEIPKYDGDLGQPSVFVPLEPELYQLKVAYIVDAFKSQKTKRWFCEETFLALMRLRGME